MIIIGDLHFGVKKFNKDFFNLQKDYLHQILSKHRNECVFQLGDIFDNRTITDNELLVEVYDLFEEVCLDYDIQFNAILGNHDLYYKNNDALSVLNIFNRIPNFNLISNCSAMNIEGMKILCVPYNCNQSLDFSMIENFDFIFGHFDIKGFDYMTGVSSSNGFESNQFKNVNVISGHYHKHQRKDNILYIGTPYQITWGDFSNNNGYYTLENKTLTFIENNISPKHIKLFIQDDKINVVGDGDAYEIDKEDLPQIKKHFIKLYTDKNSDVKGVTQELNNVKICYLEDDYSTIEEQQMDTIKSTPLEFLNELVGEQLKEELMEIVSGIE